MVRPKLNSFIPPQRLPPSDLPHTSVLITIKINFSGLPLPQNHSNINFWAGRGGGVWISTHGGKFIDSRLHTTVKQVMMPIPSNNIPSTTFHTGKKDYEEEYTIPLHLIIVWGGRISQWVDPSPGLGNRPFVLSDDTFNFFIVRYMHKFYFPNPLFYSSAKKQLPLV